jgi:hypothetical protein
MEGSAPCRVRQVYLVALQLTLKFRPNRPFMNRARLSN